MWLHSYPVLGEVRGLCFAVLNVQFFEAVIKVGVKYWNLSCRLYIPPQYNATK